MTDDPTETDLSDAEKQRAHIEQALDDETARLSTDPAVVAAQRDYFKRRVVELHLELRAALEANVALRRALEPEPTGEPAAGSARTDVVAPGDALDGLPA